MHFWQFVLYFSQVSGILQADVRDRQLTLADSNDLLHTMIEAGFHSPMQRLPG